jgi:SRSO17 transposase
MTLPRAAKPTIRFVDEYCEHYRDLFPTVESFEAFKYLHLGMISELKRKSLPAIARAVGLSNSQGLLNFLTDSPWKVYRLRQARLSLILSLLQDQEIILMIDETGDCKKGEATDYVQRQYIGNVGKRENGIVAVTAYALYNGMILPLCFEVYKPQSRLRPIPYRNQLEEHRSKPVIAAQMIRELKAIGFKIRLVLADSLDGESPSNFVPVLEQLELPYILAIRSNHALWLPQEQEVTTEPWQKFTRTFSNGETEVRYRSEIIYGRRREPRFWLLTTDPETLPRNATVYVMSNAPAIELDQIGDAYGDRTWIEYGLKQSKDALGWADFRVTRYEQIERWWEVLMSAFTMVCLFAPQFNQQCPITHQVFAQHPWWDQQTGWKNLLNNLRLIIQPLICRNYLQHWAHIFQLPKLIQAFEPLIAAMNQFFCPVIHDRILHQICFSSA